MLVCRVVAFILAVAVVPSARHCVCVSYTHAHASLILAVSVDLAARQRRLFLLGRSCEKPLTNKVEAGKKWGRFGTFQETSPSLEKFRKKKFPLGKSFMRLPCVSRHATTVGHRQEEQQSITKATT